MKPYDDKKILQKHFNLWMQNFDSRQYWLCLYIGLRDRDISELFWYKACYQNSPQEFPQSGSQTLSLDEWKRWNDYSTCLELESDWIFLFVIHFLQFQLWNDSRDTGALSWLEEVAEPLEILVWNPSVSIAPMSSLFYGWPSKTFCCSVVRFWRIMTRTKFTFVRNWNISVTVP